jgi:replicative DNA helicase
MTNVTQRRGNDAPNAVDAERCALSCGLINADFAMPALTVLEPSEFYDGKNRVIFEAMRDLWGQDASLDFLNLRDLLVNRGYEHYVNYLTHTLTYTPSAVRVEEFVATIKERARRRRLLEGLSGVASDLWDIEVSIEEINDRGMHLFQGEVPPETGGTDAEQGAVSVLAKAHYYYSNPIGQYEARGIDTGYPALNAALDGWKRGYVYYILGLEHSGKTTLALNFVMNVCREGGRCALFSLEQSTDASEDPSRSSLWERLVLSQAGVTTRDYQTGHLSDADYNRLLEAGERVSRWRLYMYDSLYTLPTIEAAVRRLQRDQPLDLVVIDYLKLLQQNRTFGNRNEEIGGLTRALKQFARRLMIPTVVPHQVSSKQIGQRSEKRIQLSDGYESGHISQDADVVLGYNRESLFDPETENPNLIEVHVLKDRIGGSTGASIDLYFERMTGVIHSVYAQERVP